VDRHDIQAMINSSIEVAMRKHNRNATLISMALGFIIMGAFVDGLFRMLGLAPPFLGLDVSLIHRVADALFEKLNV
tara:strand:+ start:117 stop:344 length:228 start_codon:yes stop_codon:yes gene_type:complete